MDRDWWGDNLEWWRHWNPRVVMMTTLSSLPGPRLNMKTVSPDICIFIIKIRRRWGRLFSIMAIPILVKQSLYNEPVSWWQKPVKTSITTLDFQRRYCVFHYLNHAAAVLNIKCALFMLTTYVSVTTVHTLITRFMEPTWGPSGADRTQVGPMLAPWTLLSGYLWNYVYTYNVRERDSRQTLILPC